jgi:outer membrane protein OmpA-like peptidoglycan-associated protein
MLVSMMNLGDDAAEAVAKIEEAASQASEKEAVRKLASERLRIKQDAGMESVKVQMSEENLLELIIPDMTLFPLGGSTLSPEALTKLKNLAQDIHELTAFAEIEVVGHTDSRVPDAKSPNLNNFALSSLRAGVVAQALIEFGIDPSRVATRGMGSLRPLVPDVDEKGREIPENMAKNRRVHIVLKTKGQHDMESHGNPRR